MTKLRSYKGVQVNEANNIHFTIVDALLRQTMKQPHSQCFTFVERDSSTTSITFAQLNDLSIKAAAWIRQEYGVEVGDVLGFAPRNDLVSVAILLGCIRLGCVILFLNPDDPPIRSQSILNAASGMCIVLAPESPRIFPETDSIQVQINPNADAFYFSTSGTTAASKIVAQTHQGTAANALAIRLHHNLKPGDRFLGCLPIHHVNGFHFSVIATLICGHHTILLPTFDGFTYGKWIERFKPRLASVVPSILEALLVMWRNPRVPKEFEYFVSAAAPLMGRTIEKIGSDLGVRILQGYGLSETINFSTTVPANLSSCAYRRQMLDTEAPTIGIPVSGNSVAILSPAGEKLAVGEVGEICVRGHNVMDRYVGNPKLSASAFRDDWFHTGDSGYVRIDPEVSSPFFVVTGRQKNIAKVGGVSISLDEVERELLRVEGIKDAACLSQSHDLMGEQLTAVIVATRELVSDEFVRQQLSERLPQYCIPQRIIRKENIPRTATGKLIRTELSKIVLH